VLPFLNLTDDPEQQYFGDGITGDLTTNLLHQVPQYFLESSRYAPSGAGSWMCWMPSFC
jgi:hypothetical protein